MKTTRYGHGTLPIRTLATVIALTLWNLIPGALAVPGQSAGGSGSAGSLPQSGELMVRVLDEESGEPVTAVLVTLRPTDRIRVTNAQGLAWFEDLPPRAYRISVERLGYAPADSTVRVEPDARVVLELRVRPTALEVGGIVVTATGRERRVGDVYQPTTTMSGAELQRNLTSSVPATLETVPGFSVQYNGPGAASPSIRGMSGDRVLMLEDGSRTGDLYQTASDHGVMIEPLTAQRMEVIRGPAGLLYGSNALGGVVNVIRNDVPRHRPIRTEATFSSQFESVNDGYGVGGVVVAPAGPLVARGELTGRNAGTTRTPAGPLPRTEMRVYNASAGLSLVRDWGYVGGALRFYDNTYGVPGEFDGQLIPGGHPGGVEIETRRTNARFRAGIQRPVFDFFESVAFRANYNRYLHDEIEGIVGGSPILGARFDQTSADARVMAHHDHARDEARLEGAVGLSFEHRDLWAGGSSPGTRSGDEWAASIFAYEEFGWRALRLQAGLRFDHRRIAPASLDSLVVRTQQRRIARPVAPRTFNAVSGSFATLWDVRPDWTAGLSIARSFRNPSIEELFSEGPHLADFSFDIGNPELDSEVGTGIDLFIRSGRPDLSVELGTFYNRVDGFIYYLQTGETVRVIREGVPPRVTPVFEARGDNADFVGAEGRIQWEAVRRVVLDATASYTRASRREDGDPLPFIPPVSGRIEARYEGDVFSASIGMNAAARQRRVPGPVRVDDAEALPQAPTDGYALLNTSIGWRHRTGPLTHSVSLQARNLTDREWRDHLSRIKDIAPQPGRNVRLTYRVVF